LGSQKNQNNRHLRGKDGVHRRRESFQNHQTRPLKTTEGGGGKKEKEVADCVRKRNWEMPKRRRKGDRAAKLDS